MSTNLADASGCLVQSSCTEAESGQGLKLRVSIVRRCLCPAANSDHAPVSDLWSVMAPLPSRQVDATDTHYTGATWANCKQASMTWKKSCTASAFLTESPDADGS